MSAERHLRNDEIPPFDVMVDRNLAVYALATVDETCYQTGFDWYPVEHGKCLSWIDRLQSEHVSVTTEQFTSVASIISPGRKWRMNLKDAYATILAWARYTDENSRVTVLSDHRVARRFGLPCFRRAWSLLDGGYVLTFDKSPKTFSFADNLAHPFDSPYVTVDQHNCHILLGEQEELGGETVQGSIGIGIAQYRQLQKVMYHCANLVGLDHKRFQSIVWQWRIESISAI